MDKVAYQLICHDHEAFLKEAVKRKEFRKLYEGLEEEYRLASEMLTARTRMGLTQEDVAGLMGTTKSAVSRMEATGEAYPFPDFSKKICAGGWLPFGNQTGPKIRKKAPWLEQETGDGIGKLHGTKSLEGYRFNPLARGIPRIFGG